MNKRKTIIAGIILAIIFIIVYVGISSDKPNEIYIIDDKKENIGTIILQDGQIDYKCDEQYRSYIDLVYYEMMELQELNPKKFSDVVKLFATNYRVETCMDKDIMESIYDSYENCKSKIYHRDFSTVVIDTAGRIKGCLGVENNEYSASNLLNHKYACSTIKPLSVYAPILEEKIADETTMYDDKPYKTIIDDSGNTVMWPQNVKDYSYDKISLEEGLITSNNAVTIRVLKDLGVDTSIDYLENNFRINVDYEKDEYNKNGDENILANVGLGYLEEGVSVLKMTECYEAFANAGRINPVHCILSIYDQDNNLIYSEKNNEYIAISKETAYRINRILKKVVSEEGTGKNADISGIDVCGKTGTSQNFKDNWFIGMTPQYVCGVWYKGNQDFISINEADGIFKEIMSKVRLDTNIKYPKK